MNDINPDDIASIEVVKGPAAATLYGAEQPWVLHPDHHEEGNRRSVQVHGVGGIRRDRRELAAAGQLGKCPQALIDNGTPVCQGLAANTLVSDNPLLREKVVTPGSISELNWSGSGGVDAFRYYLFAGVNDETGVLPSNSQSRKTGRINSTIDHPAGSDGRRRIPIVQHLHPATGQQPQCLRLRRRRRYRRPPDARNTERRLVRRNPPRSIRSRRSRT